MTKKYIGRPIDGTASVERVDDRGVVTPLDPRLESARLGRLRNLLANVPFRPFRIVVGNGDGRTFRIDGPEDVAYGATGRSIVIRDGDPDHDEEIQLVDIASIEPIVELLVGIDRKDGPA